MAYTLSNLLQDAYRSLGKATTRKLTGGTTTTIIDTTLIDKYQDDDLVNWTCFITRDAAGAAPEGEFQRISGYVESTNTATVDTAFTISPASGDIVTLATDEYPLREMIELANISIGYIGDIELTDTSITTAAGQTEYSLAVAFKRDKLIRVEIETNDDSNDYKWKTINPSQYEISPTAPGSTALLIFKSQPEVGKTIKMWYEGVHPTLTAYNSTVLESIHPNVAKASLVAHSLQWHNSALSGQDDFLLQRENKAWSDYEITLAKHPITKMRRKNPLMIIADD